ncbi:MAG: hypothetical protein PWP27_535 [Clostridiales bacterium]|jgi:hypothetical protein|nr:hypothetical protein [Clostridiales bacterium]MDK2932725.1 hypothetical protein [Clostridiales bacterium]
MKRKQDNKMYNIKKRFLSGTNASIWQEESDELVTEFDELEELRERNEHLNILF